jgi:hypothetical protein
MGGGGGKINIIEGRTEKVKRTHFGLKIIKQVFSFLNFNLKLNGGGVK